MPANSYQQLRRLFPWTRLKDKLHRIDQSIEHLEGKLAGIDQSLKLLDRKLTDLSAKVSRASEDAQSFQRLFHQVLKDPTSLWLYLNREERMDANSPVFDAIRAAFHLDRYRFAAKFAGGVRVADIACGTGYGTAFLAKEANAAIAVGVDIDPASIEYAKRLYSLGNSRFLVADASSTGLDSQEFDLITSFETIEHVPDDDALLSELHRLLIDDGILVISTPNEWPLEKTTHHIREYDRDTFYRKLSRLFLVESLFNQNSGSAIEFNRGQPRGIVPTTEENHELAECFIAVCRRLPASP